MPIGLWQVQWENLNSQRRYPLVDDASVVDQSGSFHIPNDFLLSLDLPTHAGMDVDPARFYLRYLGAYATGYSIVIGYQPVDGTAVDVATALIPRNTHVPGTVYALGGIAPFDDSFGKLVIGRLENIDQQPPGFWEFSLETARLETDAVRPMIRGVASIVCVNGDQRSAPLRGHIELQAGQNMQILPIVVAGQDPIIRFNAINGEGTVDDCVCEGDATPSAPITSIGGAKPTPAGDFTLLADSCLVFEPIDNGLKLRNTCAAPCCGPDELEAITSDLERLMAQAATVEQFTDRLAESVNTFSLVVLGSRLADKSCIQCA